MTDIPPTDTFEASVGPGTRPVVTVIKGSKLYGNVNAIEDVDFDLYPGEIHALVGENGAGKSTLCKAIVGVIQFSSGEYLIDGKPANIRQPSDALAAGHQLLIGRWLVARDTRVQRPPPNQPLLHRAHQQPVVART